MGDFSEDVTINVLSDSGDARGASYPLPGSWLGRIGPVKDVHISTLVPGGIRGNHFHVARRELLVVLYEGPWSLHWDRGEDTEVESRGFDGAGAVLIAVPPLAAHAVRNDSEELVRIVGLTDGEYDPAAPDAYPRRVVK
jgi:dTDP-4-dehydrorhamnose 3,5-epimerase-like enzyme